MKNSKIYYLLIAILIGLGIAQSNMAKQLSDESDSQKKVSCEEALKNVKQIKVGMKESEILDLLGEPTAVKEDNWGYNFFPCSPPPKIGEQKFFGIGIIFKEKVASEIGYATICAMGVKPTPKKKAY
ncbi:MAG: hypothetical protein H0U49_03970 [Parachlamydiaceae bacterium]|nr:hypothetical protein [Parachlamydiaceae bacterium]